MAVVFLAKDYTEFAELLRIHLDGEGAPEGPTRRQGHPLRT
jgi:hypothetical protein